MITPKNAYNRKFLIYCLAFSADIREFQCRMRNLCIYADSLACGSPIKIKHGLLSGIRFAISRETMKRGMYQ